MLTVKHRHNDGTETIYEAISVTRECNGAPSIPPYGDIIINGVTADGGLIAYVGPGTCHEGNGRVRVSEKWLAPEGFDEARIFVMNRFGQTIEQLRLQRPLPR